MARRLIRPVFDPIFIPIENIIQYETYDDYLRSPIWVELRQEALGRDGHRCRLCNSSRTLNVHHRKYPKNWGEETSDDLTTLCQKCHELFSTYGNRVNIKEKVKSKKKVKKERSYPGTSNARASSILRRKGLIPTCNGYTIERTAEVICNIKGILFPSKKDAQMEIVREFCREHNHKPVKL